MRVGLFINTQFPEGVNLAERIPEMVAQVRAARDAGFASLWFPHHWLTHPLQMLQITPVMAYIAAHAQGMMIGPNILILPPLNPVHVAEEAASLDVLTGGNFILGVGLGYRPPEFDAFGVSLKERAPRFVESIALMRRLWTEERVSHKGRFYTVNDAGISVKPVRPGGPPLYIAGQAEASVRRAARIGDAWLIVNTSGLGKVKPLMETYRAALEQYGRSPIECPITVECYVGDRHATAHEEYRGPLNTNTAPIPHGDCRTARSRARSRSSLATGSSSATKFRSRRKSRAVVNCWAITLSCAANGRGCRRSRRWLRSSDWARFSPRKPPFPGVTALRRSP